MKHTEGNWQCEDRFIMVDVGDKMVNVGELNTFNDEYEANAKLIAAAPEMLKKLKDAHQYFIKLGDNIQADNVYKAIEKATESTPLKEKK